MQKDPIRGIVVDEKKIKLTFTHDRKSFYFCSDPFKATLDRDHHRYPHIH